MEIQLQNEVTEWSVAADTDHWCFAERLLQCAKRTKNASLEEYIRGSQMERKN